MSEGTQQLGPSDQSLPPCRIRAVRVEGQTARCMTDAGDIMVPRVPASFLRAGDDIRPSTIGSPIAEYLAVQNALRRKARHLYFGRIGYVTQPKPDRRGEPFVRAEVLDSRLGVASLHIPNGAVRSYFYSADHRQDDTNQPTLYAVLRTLPSATPADLRLSYRMRRVELESDAAAKPKSRERNVRSICSRIPNFDPAMTPC